MADWQTLGTKKIYQNKWLRLDEDKVVNPLGQQSIYSHLELNSHFVSIVAVDEDQQVYLTQQYRYTIKTTTWEMVAGQSEGQDILIAAARELEEETGLRAESLEKIGEMYLAPGISGSKGIVILARGLHKVTDTLDQLDGIIQAKPFPISVIRRMVREGEIQTPHTITAFYMALEHLELS